MANVKIEDLPPTGGLKQLISDQGLRAYTEMVEKATMGRNAKRTAAVTGETFTLAALKQAFWEKVIDFPNAQDRRMVAKVFKWDGDSRGQAETTMAIFVPQTPFDDFDLVLSLGVSGMHYECVDIDQQDTDRWAATGYVVTPSTSNFHGWGTQPVYWSNIVETLKKSGNEGYKVMNEHKGFCGLRPPWISKSSYEDCSPRALFSENYRNIRPWDPKYQIPEEEPDMGLSLADLFAEELV